ncbi:DedA family protein [Campylobacter geochelonis]|uniref:DedA family protein n=1 Tax=Campylobacter geochelonis TaxID=1780362 RepID=UPI0007709C40|nr:DedA family protein [Campylobacter geochelonis]CZE48584.1 integral membrane protein [Campylobacter geochelonis]CZE51129.1 integral membrane protein [Campylobacter geochelonis]
MQDMLTSLSTYGYLILFFYTLGGGMVAIIAAGVLSFAGKMDLTLCILIAAVSNTLGDTFLFYISRYSKKEFAPYLKKQRRNLALAQILFKKHGDKIILIKKYIYGLKTLVPVAIGLTKYSFTKFSIINVISSIIWAVSLGLLSYYAGDFLMRVFEFIKIYPWVMPIIIVILLGVIVIYFKKATKKSKKASLL